MALRASTQPMPPSCRLLVADLVHPSVHGVTDDSTPGIIGHYMTVECYDPEEFMQDEHLPFLNIVRLATRCERRAIEHPYIRAYTHVVSRPDYSSLHIGNTHELPGGENVAILKTHWLRLVQRRYRRLLSERLKLAKARATPRSLSHREACGSWPQDLQSSPTLRGCLAALKRQS